MLRRFPRSSSVRLPSESLNSLRIGPALQSSFSCSAANDFSFEKFCLRSARVLMHVDPSVLGFFVMSAPFLAICAILVRYCFLRARWRLNQRLGRKNSGFCPSSSALGIALLFLQVFYRPSVANVVEIKQDEDADEDDEGDPENLKKQLNRQYKRIRRGEPVDRLVLRI